MNPIHDNNGASFLKASPRPWRILPGDAWAVFDRKGYRIATAVDRNASIERDEANAALIVAAVNAYSPPATGEGEPTIPDFETCIKQVGAHIQQQGKSYIEIAVSPAKEIAWSFTITERDPTKN